MSVDPALDYMNSIELDLMQQSLRKAQQRIIILQLDGLPEVQEALEMVTVKLDAAIEKEHPPPLEPLTPETPIPAPFTKE